MTGKSGKFMNIDLSSLGRLTFELAGVGVLAVITAVFLGLFRLNSAELNRIDGAISQVSADVARIEATASTVKGLEAAVEEASKNLSILEERLRSTNERLPSDRHISRLLSDLSDNGHGIKIVSIKPLQPEDKGELARLPFQINMESRFVPFGAYIERIENLPRLMIIDNITVEPKEYGSNVLNTNLFLSAYVLGYGGKR